jgi:hypothetical protein
MTSEPEWAYPKFNPYAYGVPPYMHQCQSFPPVASSSYAPRPGSWDAAPSHILHSFPFGGYAPPYGTVVGTPVVGTAVCVPSGDDNEPVPRTSPELGTSLATSPQHVATVQAASPPLTSHHHTPEQHQHVPVTSAQHTSQEFAATPVTLPHHTAQQLPDGPVTSPRHASPDVGASHVTSPQVRQKTEVAAYLFQCHCDCERVGEWL